MTIITLEYQIIFTWNLKTKFIFFNLDLIEYITKYKIDYMPYYNFTYYTLFYILNTQFR